MPSSSSRKKKVAPVDKKRVYYPEGNPDKALYVNKSKGDQKNWRISPRRHAGDDITVPRICGRRCVATTKTTGHRCRRRTCQDYRYCTAHLASKKHLFIGKSKRLYNLKLDGLGLYAFNPEFGPLTKDKHGFPVMARGVVFKKNAEIGDYGGEKMTRKQFDDRYDDPNHYETAAYAEEGESQNYILDGLSAASTVSYANESLDIGDLMSHSRTYSGFQKKYEKAAKHDGRVNAYTAERGDTVRMVAGKHIYQGEEILWHYGPEYWGTRGMKTAVTGKDW
jgi:hypothetical protein